MNVAHLPGELTRLRQWVVWCAEERDGKSTKVPYIAGEKRTRRASSTDPDTWRSFPDAVASTWADGPGFVFSADDGYCGIDLDNCVVDGVLHPRAQAIVDSFATYTELSPSGNGAHIITRAKLTGNRNRRGGMPWGGSIEIYDRGRYFTVTGECVGGVAIAAAGDHLDRLVQALFKQDDVTESYLNSNSVLSIDDEALIEKAIAAVNGREFEALWSGDASGYASRSEADLALAGRLAFWTGGDFDRILRMMRRSGLNRPKFERDDYMARTVSRALAGRTEFYAPGTLSVPDASKVNGDGRSPQPDVSGDPGPEAGSNGGGNDVAPGDDLADRFMRVGDRRVDLPPEPEWIWEGYVARNLVTVVAGKPKSGKSTLICGLATALVSGADGFLERPVAPGPVVYVSEESAVTAVDKLHDDVWLLDRETAWPRPTWAELVQAAADVARRENAVMLVIDTFPYWVGFAAEQEKDAGAVTEALAQLVEVARDGVAVVLVHHQRKGGGSELEGARGSFAIVGTVDFVLEVERVGDGAPPNQRQLVFDGRARGTPPVLLIDYDPPTGAYGVIDEVEGRSDVAAVAKRQKLLDVLPDDTEPWVEYTDLEEALGEVRRAFRDPLEKLVKERVVRREGRGVKGNPYLFAKATQFLGEPQVPESQKPASGLDLVSGIPPEGVPETNHSHSAFPETSQIPETPAEELATPEQEAEAERLDGFLDDDGGEAA